MQNQNQEANEQTYNVSYPTGKRSAIKCLLTAQNPWEAKLVFCSKYHLDPSKFVSKLRATLAKNKQATIIK